MPPLRCCNTHGMHTTHKAEGSKKTLRFIHKYQNGSARGNDLRLRQHQRKFLNSINEFRRIKWDQRKLQEKGNSLLDVGKV